MMIPMTRMTESATAEVPPLTLGWRLQMAMSHGGQTRNSMAEALGVGISTITRWTSDKGTPKKAYITQWAWLTRVSVEWLETGEVPFSDPAGQRAQGGLTGGRILAGRAIGHTSGTAVAHRKSTASRLVPAARSHRTAA